MSPGGREIMALVHIKRRGIEGKHAPCAPGIEARGLWLKVRQNVLQYLEARRWRQTMDDDQPC